MTCYYCTIRDGKHEPECPKYIKPTRDEQPEPVIGPREGHGGKFYGSSK